MNICRYYLKTYIFFLEYNFEYHKEYLWNISNMLFLFDQNYSISELEGL